MISYASDVSIEKKLYDDDKKLYFILMHKMVNNEMPLHICGTRIFVF